MARWRNRKEANMAEEWRADERTWGVAPESKVVPEFYSKGNEKPRGGGTWSRRGV